MYGVEIAAYQTEPWAVVEGIEFRSLTIVAYKGKEGPRLEHREAVIYRGPFSEVADDDGHVYRRGERTAVCRKTFGILTSAPYAAHFTPVPPLVPVAPGDARPFACAGGRVRTPSETKQGVARADVAHGTSAATCCAPAEDGGACC
jgi:hypothetical protein